MVKVTLADGPEAELVATQVVRVRRAAYDGNPAAHTLINWVEIMLVRDQPKDVADAVSAELEATGEKRLGKLSLLDDSPVWFRGPLSTGPLRIKSDEASQGYRSAVLISGKRQLVRQTHEEVRTEMEEVKGTALPIPPDGVIADTLDYLTNLGEAAPEAWDQ